MNSIKYQNRMDSMFINSENSKTFDPHKLLLNLSNKLYYTWKNMKMSYKNIKFKVSAPTLNEQFEVPDGSYSVSDI